MKSALHLDLRLENNDKGKPLTKLYDKRGNIPSRFLYGVLTSQLICYARACRNCKDFLYRAIHLTIRLLEQELLRLKSPL